MTKVKQQGNPKFSFLYGGDYYQYYQHKLQQFQNSHSQPQANPQQTQSQSNPPSLMSLNNNQQQGSPAIPANPQIWSIGNQSTAAQTNGNLAAYTAQIEALNVQQNTLRSQIQQSEQNLSAQHGVTFPSSISKIRNFNNRLFL